MTDIATTSPPAVETPETVAADAIAALVPHRWMTAREVWQRIGRWSHVSVRHALRELTAAGAINGRLSGTTERPVREYRARG